ncbi:MAG: polyphosphate:AMP phosphotransferase [Myxococcales bacterium]|nr:polyphosphate:AMP phosphotransferase [Myxococcales bacterium]MCB9581176.1 polyphosphate:AMP phosphotransferase [Polyangiaceae bacterium]
MFETAELSRTLDKKEYERLSETLRTRLLELQHRLVQDPKFSVVILIGGVEGAGKGELLNLLFEWMDARHLATRAFGLPTEEEAERPEYWRYWMALPPKGQVAVYLGSWYTAPIVSRVMGDSTDAELDSAMQRAADFERSLANDGTLIIKLWLHISEKEQKRRFKELSKSKRTAWRVTKDDWKKHSHYDEFRKVCERAIRHTSTGQCPWTVIEGTDARYRNATAAQHIVDRLTERLDAPAVEGVRQAADPNMPDPETVLDTLDLEQKLDPATYEERLEELQARMNALSRKLRKKKRSLTLVFEGWDAGGKGGAIRRITRALDARQYRVISVAAPTDEERAHHYLWRFWRHIPRRGQVTIYDRSWYGRVLVERIEGFATESEWKRAYKEIDDFEEQLVDHGIIVVKYWLHISRDEQLARFEAREREAWKHHKIGPEDFRNREKWNAYEAAANEMIERTSTEFSPWVLVEAEDKRFARIKVLETCCESIEKAL